MARDLRDAEESGDPVESLLKLQERLLRELAEVNERIVSKRPPKKLRAKDMGKFEVTRLPKGASRGISPEPDELADALDAEPETVEEEQ